jgi:hypothetical protein
MFSSLTRALAPHDGPGGPGPRRNAAARRHSGVRLPRVQGEIRLIERVRIVTSSIPRPFCLFRSVL